MQTITSGDKDGSVPELIVEKQQAHSLLRTFIALRHRNFRLFWFGQMISLTGTWMQSIGQAWLVLSLTHSAWLLGIVGALQFLPVMFLSLFGGVLADRLPKRKVLLFTQSSAMIQATVLWALVATGHVQIWHVLVLASLLGLTNSIDMPTRQAFVVEMVGREDLTNAIALNSSLFNMARVLGPGLGGLIIAWLGVAPLFLMNAISFIAVIIGLALIDMKSLHGISYLKNKLVDMPKQSTWQSLGEGLTYVKRSPALFLVIAVIGVVSLFGINFNVMLPLFATDVLHSGPAGFGFLSAAFGLGSLFSALWIAWGNNRPSIRFLLLGSLAFGVLEIMFALSPLYPLSLLLIASVGFAQIAMSAVANTTIQTIAPNHLRGRVMSVYMMVFAGSIPLGNLFAGGLAHLYGAPVSLLVGASLALTAAIVGWLKRASAEKDLATSLD
jgi:MFS family permease